MNEPTSRSTRKKPVINILIALLAALIIFFLYRIFFSSPASSQSADIKNAEPQTARTVQVDVLNGCGIGGVGQRMTAFLRRNGYDVVEMKNYKTFDVKESLVIDRIGNLAAAKDIARRLGIPEKNILQQLSPEYFVTASIVIGKDHNSLIPWNQP